MFDTIDSMLYMGITYLLFLVCYAFLSVDCLLPFTTKDKMQGAKCREEEDKLRATVVKHYKQRPYSYTYRAAPIACVLLTLGVFGNLIVNFQVSSATVLVIAFLTAYNNGTNVVDPLKSLFDRQKENSTIDIVDEDKTKKILHQVAWGHLIDIIGFGMILLVRCLFSFDDRREQEQ